MVNAAKNVRKDKLNAGQGTPEIYLSDIPGAGKNFDVNQNTMEPNSGGIEWLDNSQGIATTKATLDPWKKTLTIDMTNLVNKWISGDLPNNGLYLTGPEAAGYNQGVAYLTSTYNEVSYTTQP